MIPFIGLGAGSALCLAGLLVTGVVGTPDTIRWIAITGLACLAVLWGLVSLARGRPFFLYPSMPAAALFLAWGWLSLAWSADWRQGLVHAVNMTALGIVYLAVANVSRETLRVWVPKVAAVAVVGALGLQWYWPEAYGGFGNDNWQTEFLLLILPFLGALACTVGAKRLVTVTAFAATCLFVGATIYLFLPGGSYVKWMVLFTVLFVGVVIAWRGGWKSLAAILGLCLANGAIWALVVEPGMIARKLTQRAELTINTLAMWGESPIIGQGLGSFNHEYGRFAEWHLGWFPNFDTMMRPMHMFAGQAHNDWAQMLAELGLIGFGLAAWFIWRTWRARSSWDGLDYAAGWSLLAAGVVGLVAFPLQNPWSALIVAIALGILSQGPKGEFRLKWLARVPVMAASATIAGGLVFMAYGNFWSKAAFAWTRELIEKDPTQALAANFAAVKWWPFDGHARLQVAMSFANLISRHRPCDVEPDQTKTCLNITRRAADQINWIASGAAPYALSVKLGRIEYLLFSGHNESDRQEIEDNLAWLRDHASLQATTWLTEAKWAGLNQDAPRMMEAIRRGYPMAKDPEAYYRPQFEQLAGTVTYEEIPQ